MFVADEGAPCAKQPIVIERNSRTGGDKVTGINEEVRVFLCNLGFIEMPVGLFQIQRPALFDVSDVEQFDSRGGELPVAHTLAFLKPKGVSERQRRPFGSSLHFSIPSSSFMPC